MDSSISPYQETVSGICSNIYELTSKIEQLKCMVYELSIKSGFDGLNLKNKTSLSRHLTELNRAILDVQAGLGDCEALAAKCFNVFAQSKIPWLPQRTNHLQVMYLDGSDPWSFWVTYQDKTELNHLCKEMKKKYDTKSLKCFADIPEIGTFVCCLERKSIFRGIVLSHLSDERFKVFSIDTNCVKVVKHENMFQSDKEISELHAFAVNCCLTEFPQEIAMWNEELSGIFKSALRECKLEINVIKEIDSLPPKFIVELYGYNESIGASSNLSEWVCSRLVPAVANLRNEIVDLMSDLSEYILDPYAEISPADRISTDRQIDNSLGADQLLHYSDAALRSQTTVENDDYEEQRGGGGGVQYCLDHDCAPFTPAGHGNGSNSPVQNGTTVQSKQVWESNSTGGRKSSKMKKKQNNNGNSRPNKGKGATTKGGCSEKCLDNSGDVIRNLGNNITSDGKSNNCPPVEQNSNETDFVTSAGDKVALLVGLESTNESVIGVDPTVGADYKATDEIRICHFFAKKGYCWKPGCTKEHVHNVTGKWTTDRVEGFSDAFNVLLLPEPGEIVDLAVVSVLSANSFYAHLPDKYSVIDNDEGDNYETLSSLTSSLNNRSNISKYDLLETDPCIGDLILAYSAQNMWSRARVLEVYDDSVQVFYVDYGKVEILNCKDKIRKIDARFLHLPMQAVLCYLEDVYIIENDILNEKGFEYLSALITKKKVKAKIVTSKLIDTEMEVIIYTSEGVNINDTMVKNGYCFKF